MNLRSGLPEETPEHFYAVAGVSILLAAVSFPLGRMLYFRHWRRMTQAELSEQKMLRVLLVQHVDDLDEIIAALLQVR